METPWFLGCRAARFHTWLNIRLASFLAPIVYVNGIKCAIFVSHSISVNILSNMLSKRNPVIMSYLMSEHGPAGTGSGSSVPDSFWVTGSTLFHESQHSKYLCTQDSIDGRMNLHLTCNNIFACLWCHTRPLLCQIFCICVWIMYSSGT